MSGSKRKATSITTTNSSASDSKHDSSGTQTRQRASQTVTTRMRTRSQAKAPRAASPRRPGRPKLRHDTCQDNVFAIKDIIDEKFIHGKRHYKIDWQDDPNTGESFSPTWVCQPSSHNSSLGLTPDPGARRERKRGRCQGLGEGQAAPCPAKSYTGCHRRQ